MTAPEKERDGMGEERRGKEKDEGTRRRKELTAL